MRKAKYLVDSKTKEPIMLPGNENCEHFWFYGTDEFGCKSRVCGVTGCLRRETFKDEKWVTWEELGQKAAERLKEHLG